MAVPLVDEIPIREASHAWKETASVRAVVPLAEEVFGELRVAGANLFLRTIDVIAEEADDPAKRALRDGTASGLKGGSTLKLRRFRALGEIATTDENGIITNPSLAIDISAFLAEWLPDGQASAIADDGEKLILQAETIQEGLARFKGVAGTEALARDLGRLIEAHIVARDAVGVEEKELIEARRLLSEARAEMAAARNTARLYLQFYLSRKDSLPLDYRRVFPVRIRHSDADAKAALDAAGAEEVPNEPPPPENASPG